MKMEKNKIRIGDLAKQLNLEQFVIRFWEKEFGLISKRSVGGQRFYKTKDVAKFLTIKELLYDKGYTIAGAKKYFEENKATISKNIIAASKIESETTTNEKENKLDNDIIEKLIELQHKLIRIRELL